MKDQTFFDSVDKFIQLANSMNKKMPTSRVSVILMYANARYNAFNFYATDGNIENQEEAINYYLDQYRKMLAENMEEIKAKANEEHNNSL